MNQTTQSLLEGERIAYKIIQHAKEEQSSKVKDAQFEAKQELALIKQKMNTQYEEIQNEKEQEADDLQQYEDAAQREVTLIRSAYDKNQHKVVDLLMGSIMNVKLSLPKVVVGNFEENMQ